MLSRNQIKQKFILYWRWIAQYLSQVILKLKSPLNRYCGNGNTEYYYWVDNEHLTGTLQESDGIESANPEQSSDTGTDCGTTLKPDKRQRTIGFGETITNRNKVVLPFLLGMSTMIASLSGNPLQIPYSDMVWRSLTVLVVTVLLTIIVRGRR
jgi:hypothetical protein